MNTLIRLLNENKKISAWKIVKVNTETCELFYVNHDLETNRSTSTQDVIVNVFVDKDEKRGTSSFTYNSSMDEEEIKNSIESAIFAASLALNPYYDIPSKDDSPLINQITNLSSRPFLDQMVDIVNAVFSQDTFEDGNLSASEFFLNKRTRRIINSKGVDVTFTTYDGFIEFIPTWKKENNEEFETYNTIHFADLDEKEIALKVKEALSTTQDRAKAIDLKKGTKANVIFNAEEIAKVLRMFVDDLSYASEYQHTSLSKVGESCQGEIIEGDKLTITLKPFVQGSTRSRPVDEDGVVLKDVTIIKDSIAVSRHGSYQLGCYLNEKNPTGNIPNMVVQPGTISIEELKKEPFVECSKMSSMETDFFSGFFGGEVRLGYYFDGVTVQPVTSFSVSGNFHKLKGKFIFSKEEITIPGYSGPKFMVVKDMEII